MELKHIAFVLGSLNPGGEEIQLTQLAVKLQERGHKVRLLLPHGIGTMEGNRGAFVQSRGLPVTDLGGFEDKIPALTSHLIHHHPDVVISCGFPVTLYGTLAAYEAEIPVRVIKAGNTGHTLREFPQSRWMLMAGHTAATHAVCNSHAVLDALGAFPGGLRERGRVIRNGLDLSEMPPRDTDHVLTIGYLANVRADGLKNQLMLVRAARRLHEVGATFRIEMCGYKSDYATLVEREIERVGLAECVTLPGRIEDLSRLATWDIAVSCSHTEGFSNAIQQGMAYGLPTVATAVGGTVEIVEHDVNGYLVPDDDDASMALHLHDLLTDAALRAEMGHAARETAEQYAWEHIIPEWETVFDA